EGLAGLQFLGVLVERGLEYLHVVGDRQRLLGALLPLALGLREGDLVAVHLGDDGLDLRGHGEADAEHQDQQRACETTKHQNTPSTVETTGQFGLGTMPRSQDSSFLTPAPRYGRFGPPGPGRGPKFPG